MDIINTLIRLRDDLKEWVTNNIIEVKSSIKELESRISRLETMIESEESTREE